MSFAEPFRDHVLFAGFPDWLVTSAVLDLLKRDAETIWSGSGVSPRTRKGSSRSVRPSSYGHPIHAK
jgi:hypothetical protein